jgi:uncharacterized protein YjbI with pentapeptide repeats
MNQVVLISKQIHFSIAPPKVPAKIKFVEPAESLHDDDIYSDCLIERCIFSGDVRRLNIARAKFLSVRFEATLPATEFEDVIFEGCDLSNVNFSDAILLRTAFINCRMTGVNFSGAVLKDTDMENSMVKYANFHFARFDRAAFTECNCTNTDFGEATFGRMKFVQTDLRQSQMSGTSLADIDFTSCDIDGLGARPEDLRGVILSADQAITAAKIIGVIIRS